MPPGSPSVMGRAGMGLPQWPRRGGAAVSWRGRFGCGKNNNSLSAKLQPTCHCTPVINPQEGGPQRHCSRGPKTSASGRAEVRAALGAGVSPWGTCLTHVWVGEARPAAGRNLWSYLQAVFTEGQMSRSCHACDRVVGFLWGQLLRRGLKEPLARRPVCPRSWKRHPVGTPPWGHCPLPTQMPSWGEVLP